MPVAGPLDMSLTPVVPGPGVVATGLTNGEQSAATNLTTGNYNARVKLTGQPA